MLNKEKQTARLLDTKLDDKLSKSLVICACIMIISVLIHDGDHIRQAFLWSTDTTGTWVSQSYIDSHGGNIGLWDILAPTLLVLNLTVYIFPVMSLFLAKTKRFSALLVSAIGGVFTSGSFLILHLFGSATGLWGYWNVSYIALSQANALADVGYRIGAWSWVLLFEVPLLCLPVSIYTFKKYLAMKKQIQSES